MWVLCGVYGQNLTIKDAREVLQWSTKYDEIDHELIFVKRETHLASSYSFRKALIRKKFLSRELLSQTPFYSLLQMRTWNIIESATQL